MKRVVITIGLCASVLAFPATYAFAESGPSPIQKVLENVKDTVDNLVTAKDENSAQELSFRVQTFKKVLDYVMTEARDTRVKLFLVEDFSNKDLINWRNEKVSVLANAIKYYESEQKLLETKEKSMTIKDIKSFAKDFKEERDLVYAQPTEEAKEFLLVNQERSSVDIAKTRFGKIADDVRTLNSSKLNALLQKAEIFVNDAETLNGKAYDLFWNTYINPKKVVLENPTISTSTATSTNQAADKGTGSEEPKQSSIKDLVKSSLLNIKNAYQTFIEMSSLVRKGL